MRKPSPVLYLPHGGGPLPLLGDPNHGALVDFLEIIPTELGKPAAILVVSAHWETEIPTITSGYRPALIYDYNGFPAESYEVQYPAPGAPWLASYLKSELEQFGIQSRLDDQRGFDHGMFVPLKIMYPDADVPCIQLSICASLDPAHHIRIGRSISALRDQKILVVGSGLSFHNMQEFLSPEPESGRRNLEFDNWLIDTCTNPDLLPADKENRLVRWEQAPAARFCHPRGDHLLPLHVCYGIATADTPNARLVFNDLVLGKRVTGLLW
jgi:aromatic ring-opening dioxygenase catalytic subunit (LigB family)